MTDWISKAHELGFEAASLDPSRLSALPAVRDACAADKCGAYGKNWTCPPAVGSLAECEARMHAYRKGLLLQTVGTLRRAIDTRGYRETEERHNRALEELAELMRAEYPDLLVLGAGGCRRCQSCAYPEACRFPDRQSSSMEAYGLFVTRVCRDAGLPYYYGEKTIAYTGCILFEKEKRKMEQHIVAHRGASAYAPENTLEAFALAAEMGAWGVELDAHLTKDGQIVVAHDENLERVSDGTGFIRDCTLKELKELRFNKTHPEYTDARIPTLEEVFALLGPKGLHINVELKNSLFEYPGLEEKLLELVDRMGMKELVFYSSFNHFSMKKMKELDPSAYCGLLYEATLLDSAAYAKRSGMDAIHPFFGELLLPGVVCEEAHALGIEVNSWTVNSEEDLRAVIRKGCDCIITNYPDRGLAILEEIRKEQ